MRLLSALAALLLLGLWTAPASAGDARGDWIGTLQVSPTASLRIAVHIEQGDDGALAGTLDSPDQGATGIPLSDIAAAPDTLSFNVPAVNGAYSARWNAEKEAWDGSWSQGPGRLPLILTRGTYEAAPPPALPADWSVPGDAEIGTIIGQRLAGRTGAGMVVGVIDGSGRRIVARGPEGAAAFDGRTLFEIGSMTKVFTATLLADMVAKGEVKLDDPLELYLPAGTRVPERNGRKITLLDLATHRSGLPRLPDNMPFGDAANPYADYSERMMLDFLSGYRLTRDIGSQFEYSNYGFGLLGYALSRRAGMDYETLIRTRIIGPLGMEDTAIALSPDQRARFAAPHDAYMRGTSPWDLPALPGAGAFRSTAEDMLTFLAAQAGLIETPLAEAMKLAAEGRTTAPELGLAWFLARAPHGMIASHGGGTGGFRASMAWDAAKRRAVVVLTNTAAEPGADDIAFHLLAGLPLSPALPIPPAPPPAPARIAVTLPAAELDRVVGRYQAGPVMMEIVRQADGVAARVNGGPLVPIHAEAPLRFFWRGIDAVVVFETDAAGRVTGGTLTQDGQSFTGKRID